MSTKSATPVDKRVGQRIRTRRLELEMSQEKLADQLGITFQQVQKYENGKNRVGASRINQLTTILGVPPSYFFDERATKMLSTDPAATMIDEFMATKEGVALANRFAAIENRKLRSSLVALMEKIAARYT